MLLSYVENLRIFSDLYVSDKQQPEADVLSCPQLATGSHAPVFQLLNVFAYGTYKDYKGMCVPSLSCFVRGIIQLHSVMVSSLNCMNFVHVLYLCFMKTVIF